MATKKTDIPSAFELETDRAFQELCRARDAKLLDRARSIASARLRDKQTAERYADPVFWSGMAKKVGGVLLADVWAGLPGPVNLAIVTVGGWSADQDGAWFMGQRVCSPAAKVGPGRYAIQGRSGSWKVVEPNVGRVPNAAAAVVRALADAGLRLSSERVVWDGSDGPEDVSAERLAAWLLAGLGLDGGVSSSPIVKLSEDMGRSVLSDMPVDQRAIIGSHMQPTLRK